mgnify:FL=1|jgi:hypothetical protein
MLDKDQEAQDNDQEYQQAAAEEEQQWHIAQDAINRENNYEQ